VTTPLLGFLNGDVGDWAGLQAGLQIADLEVLCGSAGITVERLVGDPPRPRARVSLGSAVFAGGLFAWVEDGHIVALEGRLPVDHLGLPLSTPPLTQPDATYPLTLGPLLICDGEIVYVERGLAVHHNPENGLLLGVTGFIPTDLETYRTEIRPVQAVTEQLASGAGR
jgi:hypothetical protein